MARVEKIDRLNPAPRPLQRAARLILKGEVLVCPTDTGYAFAADGLNERAIGKVFELKGRSFTNPMHVTVPSIEDAAKYAEVNDMARRLAARFLPGALTVVLRKKAIVPASLVAGKDTVGIRVPDNRVILALARLSDRPITSTSANISGRPTPYTTQEVIEQLGADIEKVALVLDQGEITPHELSTIVDLTVEPPQLLRQGRIGWEEIVEALRAK